MKILFYFGHPAQYLFHKGAIAILKNHGISCDLIIKSKDVLEHLLLEDKADYINILPEGRKSGKLGIIFGLLKRDIRLFKLVTDKKYDLFIGSDPSLAHVGALKKIPVIAVTEDDTHVIKPLAKITFPFNSCILAPKECLMGKYEKKTIHFDGYMKLAYLHPAYFTREATLFAKPYFLIRVSSLNAYHDSGVGGFSIPLIHDLIRILREKGQVYISSEGKIDDSLKMFELKITPSQMQQVLSNASILISDSQSMSMEAAMLGIPSIRFSDFAGRISVLESLEHKYGLTFGIPTNKPERLVEKITELLAFRDLPAEFEKRRLEMLKDKIDVTAFMVWFIENYPRSVKIMKDNPEYQLKFK